MSETKLDSNKYCDKCGDKLEEEDYCAECNKYFCRECFFEGHETIKAKFDEAFREELLNVKQICVRCWLTQTQLCGTCAHCITEENGDYLCILGKPSDSQDGTESGDCSDWEDADKFQPAIVPLYFPPKITGELELIELVDCNDKYGFVITFPQYADKVAEIVEHLKETQAMYNTDMVFRALAKAKVPVFSYNYSKVDF